MAKAWYAWLDTMPPKPDDLHVAGNVVVANPGIEVFLVERVPQGINPSILMLDLHEYQRPGAWPQVMTPKQVRFDKVISGGAPTQVAIYKGGEAIAEVPVETVG